MVNKIVAKKVELVENPQKTGNEKILLHNGDIIRMFRTKFFLVSSYATNLMESSECRKYCAFIDLDNGHKAFSEPHSRGTTLNNIVERFRTITYCEVKDVEIIPTNNYSLQIILEK